jgi:hypothetical protein
MQHLALLQAERPMGSPQHWLEVLQGWPSIAQQICPGPFGLVMQVPLQQPLPEQAPSAGIQQTLLVQGTGGEAVLPQQSVG